MLDDDSVPSIMFPGEVVIYLNRRCLHSGGNTLQTLAVLFFQAQQYGAYLPLSHGSIHVFKRV